MKRWLAAGSGLALLGLLSSSALPAQGVTTGSINGKVTNQEGAPLAGAPSWFVTFPLMDLVVTP